MTPEERERRKNQIRAQQWQTLTESTPPDGSSAPATPTTPPSSGGVRGRIARRAAHLADRARATLRRSSATSATGTAPPSTPPSPHAPLTPANHTVTPFDVATVSTLTPNGWLDSPLLPAATDWTALLPPGAHASLVLLATARSEPPEAIVTAICEFLVEAEDERAEWPLADALVFYLDNYVTGGV